MKIKLELVAHGKPDGRRFLNFWNWRNGDDVVCEVIDGKLMLSEHKEADDYATSKKMEKVVPAREITIGEFIEMVCERNKEDIESDED